MAEHKPGYLDGRYEGFDGWAAMQDEREFVEFMALATEHKVKKYLEVGVAHGIMFHAMSMTLGPDSLCVGVDWGKEDSQQWAEDAPGSGPVIAEQVLKQLRDVGRHALIFWGNSLDPLTVDRVAQLAPYDLVFIDGGHQYHIVQADWENYGKMAPMVGFHDIIHDNPSPEITGPMRLWNEIKGNYKHVEITHSRGNGDLGIGVLWK